MNPLCNNGVPFGERIRGAHIFEISLSIIILFLLKFEISLFIIIIIINISSLLLLDPPNAVDQFEAIQTSFQATLAKLIQAGNGSITETLGPPNPIQKP